MILNNKKFITTILSIVLLSVALNFVFVPLAYAESYCMTNRGTTLKTYPGACDAAECSTLGGICVGSTPANSNAKTASDKNTLVPQGSIIGTGLLWGANYILTAVWMLEDGLLTMIGELFDASFVFTMRSLREIQAINIGWGLSRDIANMFFILILLSIAIATILRVQSHNAKALLIKLIVIALLINFSLSIGYVVIDMANTLGQGFYTELLKLSPGKGISGAIMGGTKFANTQNLSGSGGGNWSFLLGTGGFATLACSLGGYISWAGCIGASVAASAIIKVREFIKQAGDFDSAAQYFQAIMYPVIYGAVLIFVLLTGSFFLISRFVILALILILAPIAFIFYILPDTEPYWKKWWGTLINQSFFLPAFLFLLYISMLMVNQLSKAVLAGQVQENTIFFMNLTINVMLVLASLMVARTMGIYFADTIISSAHDVRQWLTGAVGGLAARYTTGVLGTAMAPSAAKLQERMPILGTAPTRFAGWLKGLGGAEKRAGAMADFAKQLTPDRQARYYAGLNTQEKAALLNKMTPTEQAEMMKFMSPTERALAEGMIKRQMPPTAAAKFDLENWKRQTAPEQRAQISQWLATNPKTGLPNNSEAATEALRSINDDEKVKLVDSIALTDPALGKQATDFIESRFSPQERQKFRIARTMRKTDKDLQQEVETMSDDDLDALVKNGDKSKVARVINTFGIGTPTQKNVANKLGGSVQKHNLKSEYASLLTPQTYIENIEGVTRTATPNSQNPRGRIASADYKKGLDNYFIKSDFRAMKKTLTPEVLKNKEFVEDVLAAGTVEDIALIAGDARRAAAFKEGFEQIIVSKATPQEKAQELAKEMTARNNSAGAQELLDYINNKSPFKEVITSILEGRAQPIAQQTAQQPQPPPAQPTPPPQPPPQTP